MGYVWVYDEQKQITELEAEMSMEKCPICGKQSSTYMNSEYWPGFPNMIRRKMCKHCGADL